MTYEEWNARRKYFAKVRNTAHTVSDAEVDARYECGLELDFSAIPKLSTFLYRKADALEEALETEAGWKQNKLYMKRLLAEDAVRYERLNRRGT